MCRDCQSALRSQIDNLPNVSLGELASNEEVLALEDLLDAVKRLEQGNNVGLISSLSGSETRLVDAVLTTSVLHKVRDRTHVLTVSLTIDGNSRYRCRPSR